MKFLTHDGLLYFWKKVKSYIDTGLNGKALASHNHDDIYYTEIEMNSLLNDKAASAHTHDDRYYTETETNNLLNNKANSSHTHTKSQITDFPSSLPANGGNADTVDGYHVSLAVGTWGLKPMSAGTGDMVSGTTALSQGNIYLVYE